MAAINRDDGRVAWVSDLPRWEDPEKQKDPITWYGPLLVGRPAGRGGHQRSWRWRSVLIPARSLAGRTLSGKASLGPIAAAGTVFVITDDGRLLALR